MRRCIVVGLLTAAVGAGAGCQSAPRTPTPANGSGSGWRQEWQASEQVLQQARAEQTQAERDLAQLQYTIYQTALSLKRMKEQAEAWDRALVTNRAALLLLEDRLLDLRNRAAAPAATEPTRVDQPVTRRRNGPEPADADVAASLYKRVAEGNAALREGNLQQAHDLFSEALQQDAQMMSARLGLAYCAYQMDDVKQARQHVRAVLSQNASQAQAISLRGLLNLRDGKLSAALDDTARAVELEPEDAQLRKFNGIVLQEARRTEQALEEMRAAARLNPDDGEALLNVAVLLARSEPPQLEEAQRFYERALAAGQEREPNLDALLKMVKE